MKGLQASGIGVKSKQAEPITLLQEEKFWKEGLIGDHSPSVLLDTIVFLCGLYFALRSAHEHRRLCPDMLCLVEPRDDRAYIEYTEHGSKNNPGGLKQQKCVNKTVRAYANIEDPSRCFIRLYKYYMSLRPENAPDEAFYLQPERKWTTNRWYQPRAMGHNSLLHTSLKQ